MLATIVGRLSGRYELLFSTGLSLAVRLLSAFSAFIASLALGRQLGAAESGYYFLAFSLVTFIAGVSRVGLDNTVLRFVGAGFAEQGWASIGAVLRRSLLLVACTSLAGALVLYFASAPLAQYVFNKPALAPVLSAMAPGIFGLAVFTILAMALQGLRRIVLSVTTLNILCNVFLIALLFYWALSTAVDAARAYSVASLLTVLFGAGCLWFVLRQLRAVMPDSGSEQIDWRQLFRSCIPLWVVLIMGQLVQWSGQFIAGAFVSSEAVAQLAVAQRTALLTSFVLMAVNLVVAPRFAAMSKQEKFAELEKLALTSVKLMALFALPIVAVMLVFPEFLMGLFGEGFSGGAHLLQILVIGQFVNVLTGSVGYLLTMSGHEKDFRNTVLISGPVAVGLAFALTPVWGATGSAVATAVAVATQNLIAVWQVKRRLGFNTLAVWRG
ncbi:oligosaccharide flippase family protein [Microbulbifer sp. ARAS458-1]|uniref:oligosaccharide flippase family protein n=1 Tax=Microbulbifer sp. ARAS458-1 TaxID=3140242 RepID=UPI003877CC7F